MRISILSAIVLGLSIFALSSCAPVAANYPDRPPPDTSPEWIGELGGPPFATEDFEIRVAQNKTDVDMMRYVKSVLLKRKKESLPPSEYEKFLNYYKSRNPLSSVVMDDYDHDSYKAQIRFYSDNTYIIANGAIVLTVEGNDGQVYSTRDFGILYEKHGKPKEFLNGYDKTVEYGPEFNSLPHGEWNRIYLRVKPYKKILGIAVDPEKFVATEPGLESASAY